MRFAKAHLAVNFLRRTQHDEQRIAVSLQLGPLVRAMSILHREIVQIEYLLALLHPLFTRLDLVEPDEPALLLHDIADFLDFNIADSAPLGVGSAVHYHGFAV